MKEIDTAAVPVIDDKELAAAQKKAANTPYIYTHKFAKPFAYEGHSFEALTFDWDALTGADGLEIENELQALGKPVIVPAFSGEYLIRMAARACTDTFTDGTGQSRRIGSDAFRIMSLSDYNNIRSAARSFLLKSES